MISLRFATQADINIICSVDSIAEQDHQRREFVAHSIQTANCHVAVVEGQVVGYGVLEYSFFGLGFIAMLFVHPDFRRRGVAVALMRHLEAQCSTAKLFTSTNLSNLPMQSLLARLGYVLSGVVHNLDEGDPELIYFKLPERSFRVG